MNAVVANLESSLLQDLAGGLDTQEMDAFLDRLFELASQAGNVVCKLKVDDILVLQSGNAALQELAIPRGKTKIRMLCARFAVRCGSWSLRDINPYGDELAVIHPTLKRNFKVKFENTTSAQSIAMERA